MLTEQNLLARRQARNDFVVLPTVTIGSAYASGNSIGGVLKIDNSNGVDGPMVEAWLSAILQSLVVADFDNQKQPITFYFFNALPSTGVDHASFTPTESDLKKLIATVVVGSGDYVSINSMAVASGVNQRNIGAVIKPAGASAGATAIYVVAVTLGTPTFTNGLQFRFQFSQGL